MRVCVGGMAEGVHRVSSQEEGESGAREERAVPLSHPTSGRARGSLLGKGKAGRGGHMWHVQRFHTELRPHIKAWEHELILGFLKPNPFLPRQVRQPEPLVSMGCGWPGRCAWGGAGLLLPRKQTDPVGLSYDRITGRFRTV